MAKRFVFVGFHFEDGDPPLEELEKTFDKSADWIRYGLHSWILYTGLGLDDWRDRIHNTPGVDAEDSFLIAEFSDYSGYQQDSTWKWLQKQRKP
jgi:hypothetical protein